MLTIVSILVSSLVWYPHAGGPTALLPGDLLWVRLSSFPTLPALCSNGPRYRAPWLVVDVGGAQGPTVTARGHVECGWGGTPVVLHTESDAGAAHGTGGGGSAGSAEAPQRFGCNGRVRSSSAAH